MYELKVLSPPSTVSPLGEVDTFPLAKTQGEALSDSFGRRHTYLRISLVEHCNLRCSYCMPEEAPDWNPTEKLLTDGEVVRIARLFVEHGVTKIRLTGGEPLLRPGIEKIAQKLGELPKLKTLALTTNALLLKRNLFVLKRAGVNLINVSLDTLQPERFKEITCRDGFHLVRNAIDAALADGDIRVKVNCVVIRGVNEDEIVEFVELTRNQNVEVRFIEFMPFDGNRWGECRLVSYEEMLRMIRRVHPLQSLTAGQNHTAKLYQVPGFCGRIGFITSMTEDFCDSCNRLRITADGHLKVCLFGRAEVNLQHAMRNGAEDRDLLDLICTAVGKKHARHAGMHQISVSRNRPMVTIGG